MTKRTKRLTLWLLAAVIVVGLAIPKLTSLKGNTPAAAAKKSSGGRGSGSSGPVAVRAYVVSPETLDDRIAVTGTISPNEQVDLQSEVPGKIVKIYFHEGDRVSRGKLLVKINDADLRAQLQRAIYQKQLATAKEARQRQLREKDAVSQAEYDVAINELNTATADIALITAQIAKTEIRAPFSGVVGLRQVSEGSYISPTTKIATLNNTDPVKIDFSVPEKYFSIVRRGSEVSFTIQGADGRYTGRVYAVEPKIDQETRTLQVRALCANGNGRIFPGSFAQIDLVLKKIDGALMVPTEAVVPELQGKKVFVSKDGKAEPRKVEVGIRTDKTVQVISGLAPGDTVITTGILQVKPGSPLKISEFQKL
jgi:membrane fusion protein (multidrug efflux system)